jgi:hypothetical protein
MSKCTFKDCQNDVYENDEFCALHCNKNEYSEGNSKGLLEAFYKELSKYIDNSIDINNPTYSIRDKSDISALLKGESTKHYSLSELGSVYSDTMKNTKVKIDDIIFPDRDSNVSFDYKKIIERIGKIHFNRCEFYASRFDVKNPEIFYQNCVFHNNWFIYYNKVLGKMENALYKTCKFEKDVSINIENYKESESEVENSIFSDCYFDISLMIENIKIKSPLFSNTGKKRLRINCLYISNCIIDSKFILNKYEINSFVCENSEFNNKFEFKQNKVNLFEINNTNYHKLVDCHSTSFKKFSITKSIFEDFVGFEACIFGDTEKKLNNNNAKYTYATFLSFINFRNAKFNDGLDLEHINLKEPPNFLNVDVSPIDTNRETYRLIKYSFDRIGNYIEANKFYTNEIKKYKEELKVNKKDTSLALLKLYGLFSDYGQSYLQPIGWILFTSILYSVVICAFENNILFSIYHQFNPKLSTISLILNSITKNIIPFSKVLKEGMEFISLIFYILFTSLIWLTILAIKRRTKR